VPITDEPIVFSAGLDKFVRIHSLDGLKLGELKQGYMLLENYEWNFSLTNYDSQKDERHRRLNIMIAERCA
jgi:hypothetical protein